MKFKMTEAFLGRVDFEKKDIGSATYATVDALELLKKKREAQKKALDAHKETSEKGLDNTEADKHSNHRLAKIVVESKRSKGMKSLLEKRKGDPDGDYGDGLWGKIYGLLTMDGTFRKQDGHVWRNVGEGYNYDDVGASRIYDEGVRVWAETMEELEPAIKVAMDNACPYKVTHDTYTSGPKKWRIDIDTSEGEV